VVVVLLLLLLLLQLLPNRSDKAAKITLFQLIRRLLT
jgi:hypothetical protein